MYTSKLSLSICRSSFHLRQDRLQQCLFSIELTLQVKKFCLKISDSLEEDDKMKKDSSILMSHVTNTSEENNTESYSIAGMNIH